MKNDTLLVALAFIIVIPACWFVWLPSGSLPRPYFRPSHPPLHQLPQRKHGHQKAPSQNPQNPSPLSQPRQQQRKPQPQPSMNIPTPGRSPRPLPAPHPVSAPIPVRAGHLTRRIWNLWPMPMSLPSGIPPAPKMAAPPTPARTAVTAKWNWEKAPWGTALAPGWSRKPLPKPPQELRSGNAPAARKPRR